MIRALPAKATVQNRPSLMAWMASIVFLQLRWFGFLSVPHFDSHVVLIAGTAGDDAVTEEGNACNEKAEENPEHRVVHHVVDHGCTFLALSHQADLHRGHIRTSEVRGTHR